MARAEQINVYVTAALRDEVRALSAKEMRSESLMMLVLAQEALAARRKSKPIPSTKEAETK